MGSYHIFRVALKFLATTDLRTHAIVLPPPREAAKPQPAEEEGDDDDDDVDEGGGGGGAAARAHAAAAAMAAQQAKAAEAAAAFAPHFAWVMVDSEGAVNYGGGVGAGALAELRAHAARSLALLDASSLDDARRPAARTPV